MATDLESIKKADCVSAYETASMVVGRGWVERLGYGFCNFFDFSVYYKCWGYIVNSYFDACVVELFNLNSWF